MKKRLISASILIAYSAFLINLLVFKNMPLIRIGHMRFNFGGQNVGQANFLPFRNILLYLLGKKGGSAITIINLVGNIALLVPIGFLVPFVYQKMTWQKSLALAITAPLAIEGMQALFRVGIFDVDDIILNALGIMIGYWIFKIYNNTKL